ncbi:hypothetical protein [Clostridium sp.]|uniref:hypothetical protein n=1 Tax=Clostridium sp. TaxID=1506 RepID=UPI001DEF7CE7|nr:hypothetical protein [Clostridium sp.]MBS5307713.1 hypothetical protein [Clostridium sp.]
MKKEQKVVYPIDLLRLEVDKVVEKQMLRGDLWREINNEFERKGLDSRSLLLLLDDDKKTASDLTDYELIAFSKVAYDKLKWKELNPKRYFGDVTLVNYENYFRTEKIIDVVELENFKKVDDFEYKGQISYKQIYDYMNNNLLIYDHEAQRSPKYREIGSKNGKAQKLKVVNINEKSVESIADSILSNNFEDSEIVLNCELIKGKKQKFDFNEISLYKELISTLSNTFNKEEKTIENIVKKDLENIGQGNIVIEPNYDMNSDFTTWVSITDGYHRCKGIILAMTRHYEKTGEWLDRSIGVKLVRATKERAKRIVHQTFLRSADEPEWVNALAEDDYTKFVDLLVKQSKRLTIENTIEEAEINDKLTSKSLLTDIIKNTGIAVNDSSEALFKAMDISKNFDLMYDYSIKKGVELNPYKVGAYIYIAYEIDDVNTILRVLEKLEDDEKFIKMCNKFKNTNDFIEYLEEVIVNV